MIALDTNILVHAHLGEASLHRAAKAAVRNVAESPAPWAICFHSLIEFYGVATQPRLWHTASSPKQRLPYSSNDGIVSSNQTEIDLLLELQSFLPCRIIALSV